MRTAQKKLKAFVDENGDALRRDYWREWYDGLPLQEERAWVAGFGPKQAKGVAKFYEANFNFIESDGTIKANSEFPQKLVELLDERMQHTIPVNIGKSIPKEYMVLSLKIVHLRK